MMSANWLSSTGSSAMRTGLIGRRWPAWLIASMVSRVIAMSVLLGSSDRRRRQRRRDGVAGGFGMQWDHGVGRERRHRRVAGGQARLQTGGTQLQARARRVNRFELDAREGALVDRRAHDAAHGVRATGLQHEALGA